MEYWQRVLDEVQNQSNLDYDFYFTHPLHCESRQPESKKRSSDGRYDLDNNLAGIYFTSREAGVMYFLLQGHTIKSCGEAIGISSRTVEFYIKNLKIKTKAYSRQKLIENVLETGFIKLYEMRNPEVVELYS